MVYPILYIFQLVLNGILWFISDAVYKGLKILKISLKKLFEFKLGDNFNCLILGFILYLMAIDNVPKKKVVNKIWFNIVALAMLK